MAKIKSFISNLFKSLIRKMNNYRLSSVILASISALTGVIALGLTFIYYFAGDKTNKGAQQPSFVTLGPSGRIMGMIFFLALIAVVILAVVVVYGALPYIMNKEKVVPKKSPFIISVVNGGLEVVVLVFSILAITLETPHTLVLYIVTIPFTVITAVANILCILPFLKCVFYQPAIGSKLCEKKQKEAEQAE